MRFDRAVLLGDGHGDLTALVGDVRCRLWIADGTREDRVRTDVAALRALAPDLVYELFPGGHHFLLSHPRETAAWLERFLGADR